MEIRDSVVVINITTILQLISWRAKSQFIGETHNVTHVVADYM